MSAITHPASRDSGLSEDRVEIRKHVRGVPLLEADEFAGDFAVAVDHVSFRVHGSAVLQRDRRMILFGRGVAVRWKDYRLVAEKFFISRGVLVGGDPENHPVAGLDVF